MKRLLALLLLLSIAFTAYSNAAAPHDKRPNFLFIAVDDLKSITGFLHEDPGNMMQRLYPDPEKRAEIRKVLTPNFDRLAESGIAFRQAYCASAACNPSRAALMTGIYPHVSGLMTNAGAKLFRTQSPILENAITLPESLMAQGYYAAGTGKIFHKNGFYDSDGDRSWHDWVVIEDPGNEIRMSKWDVDMKYFDWGEEAGTIEDMLDWKRGDLIAKVLEEGSATDPSSGGSITLPKDQPFFLACGIFRPHLPFFAPKELLDLFDPEDIQIDRELYRFMQEDLKDLPSQAPSDATIDDEGNVIPGGRFANVLRRGLEIEPEDGDLLAWRDMVWHYLASTALADRALGRLLDGLDRSPYADNTVIVLWSDHGYHIGEKLYVTKFAFWEDAAKSMFLIRDPRIKETAGESCTSPVSLLDIYPTIHAMAGADLPKGQPLGGRDIRTLLRDPAQEWNYPIVTTNNRWNNNGLRYGKYRYIRYKGDNTQIELYDLEADPEEFDNLAGKPEYAEKVAEMQQLLDGVVGTK